MIRKWNKFNVNFIDVFKNSIIINPKWIVEFANGQKNWTSLNLKPPFVQIEKTSSNHNMVKSVSCLYSPSNRNEKGDSEIDDFDAYTLETPLKTELFQLKGPQESAFLIEVQTNDLEDVKKELLALKGVEFCFDKTVIERFTIKCILRVEKAEKSKSVNDQIRLSRIHAISSSCDEVFNGEGKFFFVSSVDRMSRTKWFLQKFGYNILEILYRFQPNEKVNLGDDVRDVCKEFVKCVEKLPKVISVIHNCNLG